MSDEELIKWFKNYTAVTKDSNVKMKELETGVEISVEMAEQLIGIIEKLQKETEISRLEIRLLKDKIKQEDNFIVFTKIANAYWKGKIRKKIKEISNKIKNPDKDTYSYEIIEYTAQVEVLQELLEEKRTSD